MQSYLKPCNFALIWPFFANTKFLQLTKEAPSPVCKQISACFERLKYTFKTLKQKNRNSPF